MSYLVKSHNKKTGTTYVYEAQARWISGVGPRPIRKLIGKIDPETGEIVPTGKRGRPKKDDPVKDIQPGIEDTSSLEKKISDLTVERDTALAKISMMELTIQELSTSNKRLSDELAVYRKAFRRLDDAVSDVHSIAYRGNS